MYSFSYWYQKVKIDIILWVCATTDEITTIMARDLRICQLIFGPNFGDPPSAEFHWEPGEFPNKQKYRNVHIQ